MSDRDIKPANWTEADAAEARDIVDTARRYPFGPATNAAVPMLERALAELDRRASRITELEEDADRMRTYREAMEGLPPGTLKREAPMTRDATGRICGPCRACMTERDQLRADLDAARKEVERLKELIVTAAIDSALTGPWGG